MLKQNETTQPPSRLAQQEQRQKEAKRKKRIATTVGTVLLLTCGVTTAYLSTSSNLSPEETPLSAVNGLYRFNFWNSSTPSVTPTTPEVDVPTIPTDAPLLTLPEPSPPLEEVPSPNQDADHDFEILPEENEFEPYTLSLIGVGDNLIHSRIYLQAKARSTTGDYDFTFAYENVKDYIERVHIASINQETMMARSYPASTYPKFNTPTEMAGTLLDLGFDVISLSNNHMYDMGATGLQETLELLKLDYGFTVSGAYFNYEDYLTIPVQTVGDVDVAFIATTQTTNGLSIPSSSPLVGSVTATNAQVEEFLAQVERAKDVADIVVANIHWGSEYTHIPSTFQTDLAQRAIEAGVDVIFGHHPHVIQPVEYITRSDGTQGIVCYSLGNFLSTQDQAARMIGGMLDVRFWVEEDSISLSSVEFLPCITHYGTGTTNVQVYPYDLYTTELANAHGLSAISMPYIYNTVTSVIVGDFLPENFHTLYHS